MHYDKDSNARPPLPGAGHMEDYTNAFLITAGFLCFFVLCTLWVIFGMPFVVTLAFITERLFLRS